MNSIKTIPSIPSVIVNQTANVINNDEQLLTLENVFLVITCAIDRGLVCSKNN